MEEIEKVNTIIGTKAEVADALKKLQDDYQYIELNQMRANSNFMENDGVDLWELSYTNNADTWLARKQIGLEFFTEAEFEGGMEALYKWLNENIRYPEQARRDSIQGTVILTFIVEEDGSITNVKVQHPNSKTALLQDEAVRVLNSMPRWKPATFMKKAVRSNFFIPLTFNLK
jgi:TonB family protein